MRICLYEDRRVADLFPLTLTRPAADLLCGLTTLGQKHARHFAAEVVGYLCRPALVEWLRARPESQECQAVSLGQQLVKVAGGLSGDRCGEKKPKQNNSGTPNERRCRRHDVPPIRTLMEASVLPCVLKGRKRSCSLFVQMVDER